MLKARLYQDGLIQVGRNVMSEAKESALRSKAMLIIAQKGGSNQVWKRVMKQFIKCLNGSK